MPDQRPISIFINYRRGDTRDQAREFKKALEEQLGRGATVFLDERNIQLTEDWHLPTPHAAGSPAHQGCR